MNIFGILTMIGGLAMFLYGMSVMGGGIVGVFFMALVNASHNEREDE